MSKRSMTDEDAPGLKVVRNEEPQLGPETPMVLGLPVTHGGPGSGNFGHSGRPGQVGGSGEGGGASGSNDDSGPKATLKVEEKTYSWGTLRKVQFGRMSGVAVIHPENYADIQQLERGESLRYKDEQGSKWNVTRVGESEYEFRSLSPGRNLKGVATIGGPGSHSSASAQPKPGLRFGGGLAEVSKSDVGRWIHGKYKARKSRL